MVPSGVHSGCSNGCSERLGEKREVTRFLVKPSADSQPHYLQQWNGSFLNPDLPATSEEERGRVMNGLFHLIRVPPLWMTELFAYPGTKILP